MLTKVFLTAGLGLAVAFASPAAASFSISSGSADTLASAASAKLASSSGVIEDNPSPTPFGPGSGAFSSALATAGPVPPGVLSTKPGTSGVSVGNAEASFDVSTLPSIGFNVSASTSFSGLDGGAYFADGGGNFQFEFTVSEPTPYSVTGTYNVDPTDLFWQLRLLGDDGFLINNGTDTLDTGSFDFSGILTPGRTYNFSGRANISSSGEAPENKFSGISGTFTVPEPTSATALAALSLLASRRRRG